VVFSKGRFIYNNYRRSLKQNLLVTQLDYLYYFTEMWSVFILWDESVTCFVHDPSTLGDDARGAGLGGQAKKL
jgi:hypothetical protein